MNFFEELDLLFLRGARGVKGQLMQSRRRIEGVGEGRGTWGP